MTVSLISLLEKYLSLVLAAGIFVVYLFTMHPTVYWGDGIELTAASHVLGVAHPTGYPLFMLLGKIFQIIPLGVVGWRMNLLSVVSATWLVVVVFQMGVLIYAKVSPALAENERLLKFTSLSVALIVAFAKGIWYPAGLTEVYLLNAAGIMTIVWLALLASEKKSRFCYPALALLCGLFMGNQMLAACAVIGLFAAIVFDCLTDKQSPVSKKRQPVLRPFEERLKLLIKPLLQCTLAGLLGLMIYAYMPVRASASPPMNWGNPSSVENFVWSVRGGDFRNQRLLMARPGMPFTIKSWIPFSMWRMKHIMNWISTGELFDPEAYDPTNINIIGAIYILLGLIGVVFLFKKFALAFCVIASVVLLNLVLVFLYNISDIEGYLMPLFCFIVLSGFSAVFAGIERLVKSQGSEFRVFFYFLAILPLSMFLSGFSYSSHRADEFAGERDVHAYAVENYSREVLGQIELNSLIVTQGDNDIYPMWYAQVVENRRLDATVVGSNFLVKQPWYASYFSDDYPVEFYFFKKLPLGKMAFLNPLRDNFLLPNLAERDVYLTWMDPDLGLQSDRNRLKSMNYPQVQDAPEWKYFSAYQNLYHLKNP